MGTVNIFGAFYLSQGKSRQLISIHMDESAILFLQQFNVTMQFFPKLHSHPFDYSCENQNTEFE